MKATIIWHHPTRGRIEAHVDEPIREGSIKEWRMRSLRAGARQIFGDDRNDGPAIDERDIFQEADLEY